MIEEDYVSFEIAKLLKKKGFRCATLHYYYDKDGDLLFSAWNIGAGKNEFVAPTIQMAMKWLRDIHNYSISICLDSYVEPYDNEYYILIRRKKDRFEEISPCEQVYFKTYEEAAEAAIKYCLENLI